MGRCYRGLGQIPKARVSLQLALTLLGENKDLLGPLEAVASAVRLQNEISQLEMEQAPLQLGESASKGTVAYHLPKGGGGSFENRLKEPTFYNIDQ
jgi:hypothetical protein